MRNARTYEPKVKKLLRGAKRSGAPRPAGGEEDPVRVLVRSVLETEVTDQDAQRAMDALEAEFVDYNELRVAPAKEIAECIDHENPDARRRAEMLKTALNTLYERTCRVGFDELDQMPKKDLRRYLRELGLDPYASAGVFLHAVGGHAIPVDRTLAECLKMDGCAHPDSDVEDIQGFLERIIPQKDAPEAHAALRDYTRKAAKRLARKRRREAAARAEARPAEPEAKTKRTKKAKKTKKGAPKRRRTSGRKAAGKGRTRRSPTARKKSKSRSAGKKAKKPKASGSRRKTTRKKKDAKSRKSSGSARRRRKSSRTRTRKR